jgi:drug/metabolite transporter (DMT)-like permease
MSSRAKGALIALSGTLAWATTAIFIRYLLTHYSLSPFTLAFWRDLILSVTLLLVFGVMRPQVLRLKRQDVLFLVVYGGIVLAVFNASWTVSVDLNGAAVSTVMAYCSPAFAVLMEWLFLKERFTWRKGLAALLSLAGCVGVAKAYAPEVWRLNPLGLVVGMASALAFATYSLAGRWSAKHYASPWTVTTYGFLFAACALGLTQRPSTIFSLGTAWQGWLILAILSIGPTLMGYGLFTVSLRHLPASLSMLIASLEPALTAVLAIFLLGERLDGLQWLGAALIVAAVVLSQSGPAEDVLRGGPAESPLPSGSAESPLQT